MSRPRKRLVDKVVADAPENEDTSRTSEVGSPPQLKLNLVSRIHFASILGKSVHLSNFRVSELTT